ncbi:MAG: NAD(P)/FAD-dependent oxidoreductase [Alcaligenaceae bacterium]|nr:NAD(P)/FAD-dependent oxidoreductase [Alcaligenaceae bacterium]
MRGNDLYHSDRRKFLKTIGASGLGLSGMLPVAQMASAQTVLNDKVKIVIAGSGLAGLATASRLRKQLPNAQITILDAKKEHNYQPGYTLLATGVWKSTQSVRDRNERLIPQGVEWVQEAAAAFEPEQNRVITTSGKKLDYDYLVVATGLVLKYDLIEGMDVASIGQNGIGSVYHSPDAAANTWKAIDAFRQKGGRAVMTLAPTFMKCAGAPLKMTFMVSDSLNEAGVKSNSQVDFFAPATSIFSVKTVNDAALARWKELPVPTNVHFHRTLTGVDISAKTAYFTDPDGTVHKEDYGFLHVVPPMFAPDAVAQSNLVVAEGVQKGWLEVDQGTLQHTRYPNIFGLGDINGTARGKTAATIKKSAPIMVHNLLQHMQGKPANQIFDGYTSCPMLVRRGSAWLVEFNYAGELTPTMPLINPLQDSYLAWFVEDLLLKPAYMAVLKGKA